MPTPPDPKDATGEAASAVPRKAPSMFGCLLVRRECWSISLVGKLLIVGAVVGGACLCLRNLYPFLAVTQPVPSNILVIDGWLPTYQLEQAADEFKKGTYTEVLAVRGVYDLDSKDLDETWDDYVADILIKHGVPRDRLHSVLFPGFKRDRTYFSAVAVGEWHSKHSAKLTALNLVTTGPHARRSRLLYEMALGKAVAIGVIGLDDPSYDQRHWWRSSEGIREVLFEGIAYLYVRFFFSPPEASTVHLTRSSVAVIPCIFA
jgi:hypothetical protein